ncbi:hypothetical protein C8Q77DRAFT_1053285 [Trametes polyzona]|nr:hypothetical protein C8Q77DRAFT_1053285 [Trametes polyzona]
MVWTEAGLANLKQRLAEEQEFDRMTKSRCSSCGQWKTALRTCFRCKAAHYCDEFGQLADYEARHKRECAPFAQPPTTHMFSTHPISNEKYPHHPVCASSHTDDVGCWVSAPENLPCA